MNDDQKRIAAATAIAMAPDSKGRYIASQQDKLLELRKKNEELRK